ncbi:hypothetical protein BDQ94DRAFT_135557 [Aspergillus welwitschiae]|uniref:Uncharacterized protein n=1 Tax=Aspergillus welwitschiae TaxID=1341132 RepID=A0A3F3QFK9_9EURO|nr:hypothetical protein BDQ94DRAFT_135557 [Aspergillus welwitschiae]RDH38033.1 hypothetical protein BDQ94DRAFT_135557 [Aspergillus welwitschiae]
MKCLCLSFLSINIQRSNPCVSNSFYGVDRSDVQHDRCHDLLMTQICPEATRIRCHRGLSCTRELMLIPSIQADG